MGHRVEKTKCAFVMFNAHVLLLIFFFCRSEISSNSKSSKNTKKKQYDDIPDYRKRKDEQVDVSAHILNWDMI